jgi:hypothetical protein
MFTRFCHIVLLLLVVTSCKKTLGGGTPGTGATAITAVSISTDKATYKPGEM